MLHRRATGHIHQTDREGVGCGRRSRHSFRVAVSVSLALVQPSPSASSRARKFSRLKWAFVYLALWTLVALAFAGQHYLTSAKVGVPVGWRESVGGALADWYVFAVLSLATIHLARRFNLAGPQWRLRLILHLVARCCSSTDVKGSGSASESTTQSKARFR